jgi:hypothetical protein
VAEALDPAVHKDAPNADPYGVVLWPAAVPVASMVASLVRTPMLEAQPRQKRHRHILQVRHVPSLID